MTDLPGRNHAQFEEIFAEVTPGLVDAARKLCVLLRLAVLFHRTRGGRRSTEPKLRWSERSVQLEFPPGWTDTHPLTRADLDQEARFLADAALTLTRSEAKARGEAKRSGAR